MSDPISIKAGDPRLNSLHFKPYRSIAERRVITFTPEPDQTQTMQIVTPWGETLTAHAGDLLISEVKTPEDYWPVRADIFDESYIITRPGFCIKRAHVQLVPLEDLTGNEDAQVTVHSFEGPVTVRAGDFFLARGLKGEIWAYPRDKAQALLALADE